MSINHDKRELLKLKQGLIEDSEVVKKEEREIVELHGKKKIENFWYHYKLHVLMASFFGFLLIFFTVDFISRKRPDLDYLLVVSSMETSMLTDFLSNALGDALEAYVPNFDDNGYIHVQSFPVNLADGMGMEGVVANQTKLFSEIQMGRTRLIIGDGGGFNHIMAEDTFTLNEVFVNLSKLYPDNGNIIEDVFFRVKGSGLSKLAGIDEVCPDDFYIAVFAINLNNARQETAHTRALEVLDNIVYDRVINPPIDAAP